AHHAAAIPLSLRERFLPIKIRTLNARTAATGNPVRSDLFTTRDTAGVHLPLLLGRRGLGRGGRFLVPGSVGVMWNKTFQVSALVLFLLGLLLPAASVRSQSLDNDKQATFFMGRIRYSQN